MGAFGEQLAAKYLRKHGYYIWKRNWTARRGELDIVALKHRTLVVVEVKTRKKQKGAYPEPLDVVDAKKQDKLKWLLNQFCRKHDPELHHLRIKSARIDLVGIQYRGGFPLFSKNYSIVHEPDAVKL